MSSAGFGSQVCGCHKIGFPSRRAALKQIRKDPKKGSDVYRCPENGDLWHITSKPKQRRKRHDRMPDPNKSRALTREVHRNNRRIAKLTAVPAPKIARRPTRTACRGCGRMWLSDLDPRGRPCPQCGGEVVAGGDREFHWRLESV